MTPRSRMGLGPIVCLAVMSLCAGSSARADGVEPVPAVATDSVASIATPPDTAFASIAEAEAQRAAGGLVHLVPELADHPYSLAPGVRPYLHRISISPGFGRLGSQRLFVMRAAYNPNSWLGYEATIAHNPNHATQAIVHQFAAIVRRPRPGRLQPYVTGGYGMTIVLAGRSINADPVTQNSLVYGGGLECFIRGDLALRAEMLGMTVIGRQLYREGLVAYDYRQQTIALAFYRSIKP